MKNVEKNRLQLFTQYRVSPRIGQGLNINFCSKRLGRTYFQGMSYIFMYNNLPAHLFINQSLCSLKSAINSQIMSSNSGNNGCRPDPHLCFSISLVHQLTEVIELCLPFSDHSDIQLLFTESGKILDQSEVRDSFLVFQGIALSFCTHLFKIRCYSLTNIAKSVTHTMH